MNDLPEQAYFIDPERLVRLDLWMAEPDHPLITGKCPRCQYEFPKDDFFGGVREDSLSRWGIPITR